MEQMVGCHPPPSFLDEGHLPHPRQGRAGQLGINTQELPSTMTHGDGEEIYQLPCPGGDISEVGLSPAR